MTEKQYLFDDFSEEKKILVTDALSVFEASFDPARRLVGFPCVDHLWWDNRPTLNYALALLLTGRTEHPEAATLARGIIEDVLARQLVAPGEIFHGVFRHPLEQEPPSGILDPGRLGLYGEHLMDLTLERIEDSFHEILSHDPLLKDLPAGPLGAALHRAVLQAYPVVWDTYEPNSREFITLTFLMMLHHMERELAALSPDLPQRMRAAIGHAMEGAIYRSKSNFTPLNTNVLCMHIFELEYLGRHWHRPEWQAYGLELAERLLHDYREHHAVAEFNSPTYCAVDLYVLPFWRQYGGERLQKLGEELEEGIWSDILAFYQPSMRNICGPYSRVYELDMALHTSFYTLFYLALGQARFPFHPVGAETFENPLIVLASPRIPEHLIPQALEPKDDVTITRTFRELCERGGPDLPEGVCTATAWLSPSLMIGCMDGSVNTSHQLDPLVVFWKWQDQVCTLHLRRRKKGQEPGHLRLVRFHGKAEKRRAMMDVDLTEIHQDVEVFFEVEAPGLDPRMISPVCWDLPGLKVDLGGDPTSMETALVPGGRFGSLLQISSTASPGQKQTQFMHFDLQFSQTPS